jgi:hypothetical protein
MKQMIPSVKARHLLLAWIVVFTIAVGYSVRPGPEAHDGLCALKQDLIVRVESSRDFLVEHPKGIPGIPASVIRNGIKNQEATLRSLAHLHCN